jgi:hypothetical protein
MMGFNNIELISDRPIEVNLREMAEVKRRYPKHVVFASLMVESKRARWHEMVQQVMSDPAAAADVRNRGIASWQDAAEFMLLARAPCRCVGPLCISGIGLLRTWATV